MKTHKIIQTNEPSVPTEIIAESIIRIAAAVREMRAGRLNDKALVLLIQNATPKKASETAMSQREVRRILDGIVALESEYVRPLKTTK